MYSTMPSCNYHASDNANGLERWKHDTTWMNDGLERWKHDTTWMNDSCRCDTLQGDFVSVHCQWEAIRPVLDGSGDLRWH